MDPKEGFARIPVECKLSWILGIWRILSPLYRVITPANMTLATLQDSYRVLKCVTFRPVGLDKTYTPFNLKEVPQLVIGNLQHCNYSKFQTWN